MKILAVIVVAFVGLLIGTMMMDYNIPSRIIEKFSRQHEKAEYEARVAMFGSFPTVRTDVIMVGDSITQLGEWSELFPHSCILNRGVLADTTGGVLARLSDLKRQSPQLVFLLIGINDLKAGLPALKIVKNITEIVSQLRAPGTSIVVQSVLMTANDRKLNQEVGRLNRDFRMQFDEFVDLNEQLEIGRAHV